MSPKRENSEFDNEETNELQDFREHALKVAKSIKGMLNSQLGDDVTFENQLTRFISMQTNKVHKSVDVASGVFDLKQAVNA